MLQSTLEDLYLKDARAINLVVHASLDPEWIADALEALKRPGCAVVICGGQERFCNGLPLERAAGGGFDVIAAVSAHSPNCCAA